MDTPVTMHQVEVTRTHNDHADIPDALHLRCSCGWTSSADDDGHAQQIIREHAESGDPTPAPSTMSPD